MNHYHDDILAYTWTLDIIDTHEHLPDEAEWAARTHDILPELLTQYIVADLISAGMTYPQLEFVRDSSKPLAERWAVAEPFWDACRHTGYGRCLDRVAQDLYGLPAVNGETLGEMNDAFLARRKAAATGESYFRHVLREKSRIALSITDSNLACDREMFRSVYRLDDFLMPRTVEDIRHKAYPLGMTVHSLDDWKEAAERDLDRALEAGAVGLKSGLAYHRSLRYDKATTQEAEESFNALRSSVDRPEWDPNLTPQTLAFQNHMMHHILTLADRRGLTFQFHTGLQEGNANHIANANPELMTPLFQEYRNVRFDIFHIGYPYHHTLAAVCKNYPNVTIDFAWSHIISPNAARVALAEYLDTVPANKILGFGGDFGFPDGVYGHVAIARENIAAVLAGKVAEGIFDLDRAKQLARRMLFDTPKRIFHL